MALTSDISNAVSLLLHREWRECIFRLRVHIQKIDLKNVYLDELHLPEERCHYYANSGGPHLDKVLRTLNISPQDSIVDFGSGKGGALIKLNLQNITMFVADAADFTDLDEYNYFYFFSPFPGNVMRAVIEHISASLRNRPRKTVIIYFNPECHDDVVNNSPFVKVTEFHHHELGYYVYTNTTQ